MKKEKFICGGCGEDFDSIFDNDDANYDGSVGCGIAELQQIEARAAQIKELLEAA